MIGRFHPRVITQAVRAVRDARLRLPAAVTDLEAFRAGAAANGAYDSRYESASPRAQFLGPYQQPRLYDDSGPVPTVSELSSQRPTPSCADRPALSVVPPDGVDGAGHPNRHVYSIAEACERIDILVEDNVMLQRQNRQLRKDLARAISERDSYAAICRAQEQRP